MNTHRPDYSRYTTLAELFRYPGDNFEATVQEIAQHTPVEYPETSDPLNQFLEGVNAMPLLEVQELYTRSFEVQAVTTLDIGYVLFGDDYKRGALLVNLSREMEEVGIETGSELADNLANVLTLIGRMTDDDLRAEMVDKLIVPAISKMISEFEPTRIASKNKAYKKHYKTLIERQERWATIYRKPLQALYTVLNADFEVNERELLQVGKDFLGSVGSEIRLEGDGTSPPSQQQNGAMGTVAAPQTCAVGCCPPIPARKPNNSSTL